MEWIVKFEHTDKQRVKIDYNIITDFIKVIGQLKIKNNEWIDVTEGSNIYVNNLNENINSDRIVDKIYLEYEKMIPKIETYEKLMEMSKTLKLIEVVEESNIDNDTPSI